MTDGTPAHRNRSLRLVLFGLIAAAVGAVAVALGLAQLMLLVPAVGSRLPPGVELEAEPARLWMGAISWALVGSAFIAVGVGSMRRRRWARPLMLTLAWSWLACGFVSLLLTPALLDMALASSGLDAPTAALVLVRWFVLALVAGVGVVLPAIFVWVYHDSELERTCEALDARPSWTDRRPAPVIGLAVALAACGVLFLPMAFQPAVPLFGRLLTGGLGAVAMIAGAVLCFGLALAVYRTSAVGWWGTAIFMVLVGASTLVSQLRVPAADWYAALGYPPPAASSGAGPFSGPAALSATTAMTVASILYMLRMRRHFTDGGR